MKDSLFGPLYPETEKSISKYSEALHVRMILTFKINIFCFPMLKKVSPV